MTLEKSSKAKQECKVEAKKILENEHLTGEDLRKYITTQLEAVNQNLEDWDTRRDKVLLNLMTGLTLYSIDGDNDLAEANYRSILVLVDEPLVVSKSADDYKEAVKKALSMVRLATLRTRSAEDIALFNTNLTAIVYNAKKFCPESVAGDYFKNISYNLFKQGLDALRGTRPQPLQ